MSVNRLFRPLSLFLAHFEEKCAIAGVLVYPISLVNFLKWGVEAGRGLKLDIKKYLVNMKCAYVVRVFPHRFSHFFVSIFIYKL